MQYTIVPMMSEKESKVSEVSDHNVKNETSFETKGL